MTFRTFAQSLVDAANSIVIPVLFGVAFLSIIYGVVKYFFLHSDSEESRREGRYFVIWGIVGTVILFSVWGIVYILLDTLGISPT